jgi:hypothetical protein
VSLPTNNKPAFGTNIIETVSGSEDVGARNQGIIGV